MVHKQLLKSFNIDLTLSTLVYTMYYNLVLTSLTGMFKDIRDYEHFNYIIQISNREDSDRANEVNDLPWHDPFDRHFYEPHFYH